MRKFVLGLLLALAALVMAHTRATAGQDTFDFGDLPPLPPSLLDDAPAPPPLSVPSSPSMSPLAPPSLPASTGAGSTPPAPTTQPPVASSPLTPPPLTPPPLAPPPLTPPAPSVAGGTQTGETETGLAAQVPPPVATPGPTSTQSMLPPAEETPRPGKITGGRVNVRAGPNTQYESIDVLTTGAPVTVLAKNGDWFKIVFPADKLASIHKNFVNADITGEIPEEGVPGIVNQDDADVHAFYWDKSTVVGKLNKGDPVVIKQERGQWYRIAAPESARAYVFAQYVRVDGNENVAVDSTPPPENPSVDLTQGQPDATGRLKMSENDRKAQEIKEAYFARLQAQYKQDQEEAAVQVNRLEEALDELETKIRQIDQETSTQMTYPVPTTNMGASGWAPEDPLYGGFTGWVENIGRVGGGPASYRLTRNGEIRYFLRSDKVDLGSYAGQRVWVNGTVELASGGTASVLNVDQIRILTEADMISARYAGAAPVPSGSTVQGYEPYQPVVSDTTVTTGVTVVDPYQASPSDPYAQLYDSYQAGGAAAGQVPMGSGVAAPVSDASQLPDVVGAGQLFHPSVPITGSAGEVDTDYFESPNISEVGP